MRVPAGWGHERRPGAAPGELVVGSRLGGGTTPGGGPSLTTDAVIPPARTQDDVETARTAGTRAASSSVDSALSDRAPTRNSAQSPPKTSPRPAAGSRAGTTGTAGDSAGVTTGSTKPSTDIPPGPIAASTAAKPPAVKAPPEPEQIATHRRRVRDRLSRRLATNPRQSAVQPVLEPLLAIHRSAHAKVDARQLQRGYDVAEQCHRGQLRKSGDPYITHPLAVATILARDRLSAMPIGAH